MCRLHHKGCPWPKRGCKVRTDIYEKVGSKTRKALQNTAEAKYGLQLYDGKIKIDVPTSPRGVAVAKHRLRK